MNRFRIRLVSTFVLLALSTVPFTSSYAEEGTVTVEVSRTHPAGATAPIAGTLKGLTTKPGGLKLSRNEFPALEAQQEQGTNLVWMVTRFSEKQQGQKIVFQASAWKPDARKNAMRVVHDKNGCWFYEGDRKQFYYRKTPKSLEGKYTRAGYVHPLSGLDGETLTQEFPADHKHHHGVFWAWHQFWVGDLKAGDPWITKDFIAVVKNTEVFDQGPVFATLKATVEWTSPLYTDKAGKPRPIVEEQTLIRAFRSTKESRWIDFEISLKALVPNVKLGGAENVRGYSGFTVRVAPPEDQIITDVSGPLKTDNVGTVSRWADVSGTFQQGNSTTGIAILSHASLPEFPPKWLLRHYGMQNVVYPGQHPIEVSQTQPLVLRHRLYIHRGDVREAGVNAQQNIYELTP